MVRGQSMSRWRGRLVRCDRSSAPRIASAVFCSSRCISLATISAMMVRGNLLGLGRHDRAQRDQVGDEIDVGLDRLEELRLHQHLLQVEPLEGILLDDLHDLARERTTGYRPSTAPLAAPSGRARRAACADRPPYRRRHRRRAHRAPPTAACRCRTAPTKTRHRRRSPGASGAPVRRRRARFRRCRLSSSIAVPARQQGSKPFQMPAPGLIAVRRRRQPCRQAPDTAEHALRSAGAAPSSPDAKTPGAAAADAR